MTRKGPCPEELTALLDLKALLGDGQDHLCFADRTQIRSQTSNASVMCKASLVRQVWRKHKNRRSNKYKVEKFRTIKNNTHYNLPWAMQPGSLDCQALKQTAPFPQRLPLCWLGLQHGMAAWDGSDSTVHSPVLVTNPPRPQIMCANWVGCSGGAGSLLPPSACYFWQRHFSVSCGKAQFSGPLTHW